MLTTATSDTMDSSLVDEQTSSVTSKTILNVGLQMQGKDQLNKQMQEWQRRMDDHKQVERSATANKLIFERNLRIMQMGAKQQTVQEQPQYPFVHNNNIMVDNSNQVVFPIFYPLPVTFQSPAHLMLNLSNTHEVQHRIPTAKLQYVSQDLDSIPQFPSPQEYNSGEDYQSSCNQWLLWHRTKPPTPFMRSDPVSEHEATASYEPTSMRLDYLPFTSEDDIPNIKTDSNRKVILETTSDNDEDEDHFNVML